MEAMVGEHEMFRAEHKMLLRSQVLLREFDVEKQKERIDEIGGKLDVLIDVVDLEQRNHHGRLRSDRRRNEKGSANG